MDHPRSATPVDRTDSDPVRGRDLETTSAQRWWRPVLVSLWAVSLVLIALSAVMPMVLGLEPGDRTSPVRVFVDVTGERNLPAWWNSGLFLVAAVLSLGVGMLRRSAGMPGLWGWLGMSALLAAMSLDELTSIHERLPGVYERLFGENPLEVYQWLMLGVPLAAAVLLFTWWTIRGLPRPSRRLFGAGFVVFFLGAIGVEAVTAVLLPTIGQESVTYVALYHLEEALEFLGASLMAVAPLGAVVLRRTERGTHRLDWMNTARVGRSDADDSALESWIEARNGAVDSPW